MRASFDAIRLNGIRVMVVPCIEQGIKAIHRNVREETLLYFLGADVLHCVISIQRRRYMLNNRLLRFRLGNISGYGDCFPNQVYASSLEKERCCNIRCFLMKSPDPAIVSIRKRKSGYLCTFVR